MEEDMYKNFGIKLILIGIAMLLILDRLYHFSGFDVISEVVIPIFQVLAPIVLGAGLLYPDKLIERKLDERKKNKSKDNFEQKQDQ